MKNILDVRFPEELNSQNLVRVNCPICRENGQSHYSMKINDINLGLQYCDRDDLWWVSPRPNKDFYSALYTKYFYNSPCPNQFGYANYEEDGERRSQKAIKNIEDFVPFVSDLAKESLLEIGCATGELLIEAAKFGWKELCGVEIDPKCCETCRDKKINIYEGFFEDINFNNKKFKSIFADNVFEHVLNPDLFMEKCSSLQDEGDFLIYRLPETEQPGPRLKLVDHTYHYTRKSIKRIFEKYNYAVKEILYTGTYTSDDGENRIINMTVIGVKNGNN
ncbi:class I SAM-dependent methyltransferase [Bacteriovoracaceae bacterium]|nr:class I SAM-dependent methyltransferase [Bacteriovoracaceae bacterium]